MPSSKSATGNNMPPLIHTLGLYRVLSISLLSSNISCCLSGCVFFSVYLHYVVCLLLSMGLPSVSLPLCLTVSLSLRISICFFSLSFSVSLSVFLSLSLSVSLSLSLSLLCLHLIVPLSHALFFWLG